MHKKFDHHAFETKWQDTWEKDAVYKIHADSTKPKTFVLDMFPYPSGEGLHVGHPKGYIATDVYSRMKRMTGHEVLHPMGWDAFGLPAENFAIKHKVHPRQAVDTNIANFKAQLAKLGLDYDWSREINTTDPAFYKWTQWIFIQLLKKGLAYESTEPINWCPGCQTGLANEDLESDGTCERCDSVVEKRPMRQWTLKIREYADRMLEDLDTLEWPEHIKEAQRNWIGKSEGAEIDFQINTPSVEKRKVLILHGFAGDPNIGWKPWLKTELEKLGFEVRNPKLPNFDKPDYEEVMDFLRQETSDFTENDIIVGHSLGTHFALKLVEEKALGKVVCVAPSNSISELPFDEWREDFAGYDVDSCIEVLQEHPVNEDKLCAAEKVVIFGETDEHVPASNETRFNEGWKKIVIPNVGHMSEEVQVPEILKAVIDTVTVFTTRPDTLFGATYMVLAPEHELVRRHKAAISNWPEVEVYITATINKKEMDRLDDTKEKTGVKLEGITATNPANGEEIPVYIADYVLASYGTGAIMAVPAHDERDFAFAKKFGIEVKPVIMQIFGEKLEEAVYRNAVGAIVHNANTDKYLVQYSKEFQKYSFIFGGLEKGETYEDAAVRETFEETGYRAKFHSFLTDEAIAYFYHPGKKINRKLLSRRVLLELESEDQSLVSDEELEKAAPVWLTKDELFEKITDPDEINGLQQLFNPSVFTGSGILTNSGEFDGMDSEEARRAIVEKVGGRMTSTYKIKDWVFSRQRYWGEPFPIVHLEDGTAVPVAFEQLPVTLPAVDHYEPAGDGRSPLANITDWMNVTGYLTDEGDFMVADEAPAGKELVKATRETNTMPQWAGSSWYYLRYIDPQNEKALIDSQKEKDWMPVDVYVGGDHAVRHLIYARFWHKFLYDIGVVSTIEPFQRLEFLGFILAEDGRKMSKRWGNVINPNDVVERVGADTLRVYEMFMGPFENTIAWSQDGVVGARRFLERVNGLAEHITEEESAHMTALIHKTIKKVRDDIEAFKFNTAVSAMMIYVNEAEKHGLSKESYGCFLRLLAPFAPHLTEELWHEAGFTTSIHLESFPEYDAELAKETSVVIGVQVNGKVRGDIEIAPDASEEEALTAAKENENVKKWLDGNEPKKVIYRPGKIINIIL